MEHTNVHLVPDSIRESPASARRRLSVLLAVTRALADAPSLAEGARRVLGIVGDAEGWSAGVLWVAPERGEDRPRCAEVWCVPSVSAADLERASRDLAAGRGAGLVGRVFASGRVAFAGDDELRRDPRVEREGFRASAAVPIPGAAGAAGVLELFSRCAREPDPFTDELWAVAAGELGQIARRAALEQALSRSEAQLIEAGRLAALGTLTAGVAHEINNPLSYVLLDLDLMIRDIAASPELVARLEEARAGIERVRLIVQDLKSFSRTDAERRRPVDVRRELDATLELAANEIRHRARLSRAYGDVPEVYADPSRLGQVFLNLIVNAAQAMPEGEASRNEIRVATLLDAAGRVVVEIADTGAGIAPDHLGRIFEPFFTTKPPGVGTGLGLSICRGLVSALGGEITVESQLGRGTTFRVTLPAGYPES